MKQPSAKVFSLMVLLASTTMLSACDMFSGISQHLRTSRSDQEVLGPRHAPVLNPAAVSAVPAVPAATAPVPVQHAAAPPPSAAADPYDYYDGNDNEIDPSGVDASSGGHEGFLDRLFGSSDTQEKQQAPERKQIPGNPQYSKETSPAAPIPAGPQPLSMKTSVPTRMDTKTAEVPPAPLNAKVAADNTTSAPASAEDSAPVAAKPSWFARNLNWFDKSQPVAPSVESAGSADNITPTAFSPAPDVKPDAAAEMKKADAPAEVKPQARNQLPTKADREAEQKMAQAAAQNADLAPAASAADNAPPVPQATAETKPDTKPVADNTADAGAPAAEPESRYTASKAVHWVGGLFGMNNKPTLPSPDANAPAPALSSVPQKPEEFNAAKAAQPQKTEEMQAAHDIADEQKANLDSEPSQQAATPVAMPADSAPAKKDSKPAVSENKPADNAAAPVLLGHLSTPDRYDLPPPTPLEKTVPAEAAAAPASEPVPVEAAAPAVVPEAPVAEKAPEKPADKPAEKPADVAAATPAAPAAPGAPADVAPVAEKAPEKPAAKPVETAAAPSPVQAPAAAPAPVADSAPVAPAAPVATVSSDQAPAGNAQTASDQSADGLPSPSLLQQVKVLPPSRYMVREQAQSSGQ